MEEKLIGALATISVSLVLALVWLVKKNGQRSRGNPGNNARLEHSVVEMKDKILDKMDRINELASERAQNLRESLKRMEEALSRLEGRRT